MENENFYYTDSVEFKTFEEEKDFENDNPILTQINPEFTLKKWIENGLLHRTNDLPSVIKTTEIYKEYIWYQNGLKHRENNKPAHIKKFNDGTFLMKWYINDRLDNELDNPAIIVKTDYFSSIKYYRYGLAHRGNDSPAEINSSVENKRVSQFWFKNGVLHRNNDLPARIIKYEELIDDEDDDEDDEPKYKIVIETSWFKNGYYDRENDKPSAIKSSVCEYHCINDIDKIWRVGGRIHRENDKPAVKKSNGTKKWYLNDEKHRENDKPAIVRATGFNQWFLNGKEQENPRMKGNGIKIPESDQCQICFNEFVKFDTLKCKHEVHLCCIVKSGTPHCPFCRIKVDLDVHQIYMLRHYKKILNKKECNCITYAEFDEE